MYCRLDIERPLTSDRILDNYLEASKSTLKSGHPREGVPRDPIRKYHSDISHADLLDLLKHQQQLQWAIHTLTSGEDIDERKRQRAVNAAKQTTAVLESTLLQALDWDPLAGAPTSSSASKAQRVFDVPELAEAILCMLPAKDLISATQVNHAFYGTAVTSPKLQMLLGLRIDSSCYWRSNFGQGGYDHPAFSYHDEGAFAGFQCGLDWNYKWTSDPKQSLDKAKVKACFSWARGINDDSKLPKVGPRIRKMLVCQPPILEVTAEPSCCVPVARWARYTTSSPPPQALSIIRSDTGLTIGDLLDAAAATIEEHRQCPHAKRQARDGGIDVTFTGYLTLVAGDPALPRYLDDLSD